MKRYVGAVVLVVGLAVVAAGCGSTRFVVVDNQGAGASSATATTAAPAAGGDGGTASGPTAATAAQIKEFEAAYKQALTIDDRSFAERKQALTGADDLGSTFAAVVKLAKPLGVKLEITSATVDGDTATATTDVIVSGAPFAQAVPVPLERVDGKWKVTRTGACAVLALGSPCPDAPAS
jgi:hypothetical protein